MSDAPKTIQRRPHGRDFFVQHDSDEAGIAWLDFLGALQVWSFMRLERGDEKVTVRQAADEFGVTAEVIREAVDQHYWMFLSGPDDDPSKQIIEHDGE